MTFRDYQTQARRTQNRSLTPREQLDHSLFGLSSEVGEICGIHQKKYQGHPVNIPNLRKEIGDVLWFIAELCDTYKFDMGLIAEQNIEKLKKRYPNGFSQERSLHRVE